MSVESSTNSSGAGYVLSLLAGAAVGLMIAAYGRNLHHLVECCVGAGFGTAALGFMATKVISWHNPPKPDPIELDDEPGKDAAMSEHARLTAEATKDRLHGLPEL